MARPVKVEVIGDAASYTAALGLASSSTEKFAEGYKAQFAAMQTSTLALSVAQDKLAISTARYGVGTTGAARATLAYRREVDMLRRSQIEAAAAVGRGISRYITAPTLLASLAATKMAVDFQRNMLLISTQAGASATEVRNLSGQVLDLAKNSALGPNELAQGLYHLESLGLRGANAMRVLKVSSDAAFMGVANLEEVTTALGGAVVTGIRGTAEFAKAMGTLDATIGAGNMRMEDLIGALGTGVLPAAKNAGLSLDQVGAALAVMTDRGVDAESAGTRLRMTFALMQAPSKKAVESLGDLGIKADQMATLLRTPNGLLKVLQLLHDAVGRVGAVRGSQDLLRAFGGGRSGAGILTLVQSLDSATSSFESKLAQIQQQSGKFGAKVAQSQQSDAYKVAKAWSSVQVAFVKLGGSFAPTATTIAEAVGKIADAIDGLPGPVKSDLGIIIGLLAVGGPLILAGTATMRMVQRLSDSFKLLPASAGPAIAATEAEFATLPVAVGAAAAKTEAEIAGIGASAATATGEIATLRGGLLGLAGKTFAVGLVLDIATSFLPQGKDHNPFKGIPILGSVYGFSDYLSRALFGNAANKPIFGGGGSKGPAPLGFTDVWPLIQRGIINVKQIEELRPRFTSPADYNGALAYAKSVQGNPNPHDLALGFGPEVTGPLVLPLSKRQEFNNALLAHPDSIPLLKQKAAADRAALAFAEKLRERGRIDNTKYEQLYKSYTTDLVNTEQHITTLESQAASKASTKRSKAQREYESKMRARAQELRNAVSGAPVIGPHGEVTAGRRTADDALVAFYKQEAHDSKLTAEERARYAGLAIEARQREVKDAAHAAEQYERAVIAGAKAEVAKAKLTKGNIADDETALRALIRAYMGEAHNKALPADVRAQARSNAATTRGRLAALRNTYTIPLALQLEQAYASTTASPIDDVVVARKIRTAAQRALKAGHLAIEGQIAVLDIIAQENQTIADSTQADLTAYHVASVTSMTAGIKGLTGAARKEMEMRIAQAGAHRHKVPVGSAALGIPVAERMGDLPPIHVHVDIDGREVGKVVLDDLQKRGRRNAPQRGGSIAGRNLGMH